MLGERCNVCPFTSLSEAAVLRHFAKVHADAKSPKLKSPQKKAKKIPREKVPVRKEAGSKVNAAPGVTENDSTAKNGSNDKRLGACKESKRGKAKVLDAGGELCDQESFEVKDYIESKPEITIERRRKVYKCQRCDHTSSR